MSYPENEKGLEFGESYFWNVEGEYPFNTGETANHKFSVLSLEKSKEVKENENTIRNTFKNDLESSSLHSFLGAYYYNIGLLQDAICEIQIIAKINMDAALPHEILGSLYSEVGDKDKAINELQKALIMIKNKDKCFSEYLSSTLYLIKFTICFKQNVIIFFMISNRRIILILFFLPRCFGHIIKWTWTRSY